jgi:transcriptional regulator with XRE-family HTH domain
VSQSDQARQLASRLQILKTRTNRSYEALSHRIGVSRSTLHRYCSGAVVPPTYDVIVRFCKVCGATREEAEEVLRYWALAVNGDHRPPHTRGRWLPAMVVIAGVLGGVLWGRRAR